MRSLTGAPRPKAVGGEGCNRSGSMPLSSADVENLLKPVSPERPSGEDLGDDPEFMAADDLLKEGATAMIDGAPIKEADWRGARGQFLKLLERGKDLRVVIRLTLAM